MTFEQWKSIMHNNGCVVRLASEIYDELDGWQLPNLANEIAGAQRRLDNLQTIIGHIDKKVLGLVILDENQEPVIAWVSPDLERHDVLESAADA